MKKRWALVVAGVLALLCAAGIFYMYRHVKMPDLNGVDVYTAKEVLSSKGLIPSVAYIYHHRIAEGEVIRTKPSMNTIVERDSKIILYVSKGPSHYSATNAEISWYSLSDEQDEWLFSSPFVDEEVLYISCTVRFAVEMAWKDTHGDGHIHGIASTAESFKQYIPIETEYQKQAWNAREKQRLILQIPLAELNTTKPNAIYVQLYTADHNDVNVGFYMAWQ